MFLVNEYGSKVDLKNDFLPEDVRQWRYSDVKLIDESVKLVKCYIAMVNKYNFETRETDYIGEKVYDHYPTQEELIWLLAEYDALGYRDYVAINDGFMPYLED